MRGKKISKVNVRHLGFVISAQAKLENGTRIYFQKKNYVRHYPLQSTKHRKHYKIFSSVSIFKAKSKPKNYNFYNQAPKDCCLYRQSRKFQENRVSRSGPIRKQTFENSLGTGCSGTSLVSKGMSKRTFFLPFRWELLSRKYLRRL